MDIQLSVDILSASRRKIHRSISVRIGLPWQWRSVKDIIMKKALLTRAMRSRMLIWTEGLSGDEDCHSGRHLKTELEILHCRIRGKAETSHGNVTGVLLTHKVGSTWNEETYREMPHLFGGGFQKLA